MKTKTLIICIDRDNDVGKKTGKSGPIIGRDANIKVATDLLLQDPAESDANAIFAAVKVYDNLKKEGEDVEVATITGHEKKGLVADKIINEQLNKVLLGYNAERAIVVTDGADDEFILPIVQSKIPIYSMQRVIVQQSQEIETTVIILMNYIKRYARIVLGIPGIFFIAAAILYLLNQLQYLSSMFLLLVGSTLAIKGFKLDTAVKKMLTGRIEFFTMVSGLIIIFSVLFAIYQSIFTKTNLSLSTLLIETSSTYLWLIILGFVVWFSGGVVEALIKGSKVVWDRVTLIVTTVTLYPVLLNSLPILLFGYSPERLLNLLIYVMLGMVVVSITFLIAWKKKRV